MMRVFVSIAMALSFFSAHGIMKPSFNDAMTITEEYIPERAASNPLWIKIAQLYNNTAFDCPQNGKPLTPHIIHHIWLGSKLPDVCAKFRKTWIDQHPTWMHILWTDNISNYDDSALILSPQSFNEIHDIIQNPKVSHKIIININHLQFSTLRQFQASKNYGEKSDILRYEILFMFGGLYVDTDFKCIHRFDDVHQACSFFAGLDFSDKRFTVFNGLIGATPQHSILKSCVHKIRAQSFNRTDGQQSNIDRKIAIMERTGPYFLSKIVSEYIMKTDEHDSCVLFPVSFLYPYPHMNLARTRHLSTDQLENKFLKPESLAIHFWHVSWDPAKNKKSF